MQEARYEVASTRAFAGLSFLEVIPDDTTILRFRQMLERERIAQLLPDAVSLYLACEGIFVRRGTMVDATIIAAPSATKNNSGERDLMRTIPADQAAH